MAVVLVTSAAASWRFLRGSGRNRADLVIHHVQRETLIQTIVERGELQSANNHDVYNLVQHEALTGAKTSIKWVIDDGKPVNVGDLLIEMDDSRLKDLLDTQNITRDKAHNDYVFARANLEIVIKLGLTELATSDRAVKQADTSLKKYRDGDHPQTLKDLTSRIDLSRGELEQVQDNTRHIELLVKKKFMSASQGRAAQLKLRSAEENLNKLYGDKKVLDDFTYPQTMQDLQGKLDDAIAIHERVVIQAKAQKEQAENELKTKKLVYDDARDKCLKIQAEIAKCKIKATAKGLVVYFQSQQSRRGSGGTQAVIAEGEQVFLGQKLFQIPDLKNMEVLTRVHEAMVRKVTEGQRVRIRPHAFHAKILNGEVKSVGSVAVQQDWFSGDVKVYEAKVKIEGETEGLKPGMSAEVTLFTDNRVDDALTVPVQAVVRIPGEEIRHKVYVRTSTGVEPREVKVGMTNDKKVEIKEGISEGDEVVLNEDILGQDKKNKQDGKGDDPGGKNRKKNTDSYAPTTKGERSKERS